MFIIPENRNKFYCRYGRRVMRIYRGALMKRTAKSQAPDDEKAVPETSSGTAYMKGKCLRKIC